MMSVHDAPNFVAQPSAPYWLRPRPWPKPLPRTTIAMGGNASADARGVCEDVMSAVTARHADTTSERVRRVDVRLLMGENARRFGPLNGGAPRFRVLGLQRQREQASFREDQSKLEFG